MFLHLVPESLPGVKPVSLVSDGFVGSVSDIEEDKSMGISLVNCRYYVRIFLNTGRRPWQIAGNKPARPGGRPGGFRHQGADYKKFHRPLS